jgi:ABC-type Na+ efflux pump permease subunit
MPAAIVARFVLLEARRGGLPWLAAGCVLVALGLATYLSRVALTESTALQAAAVAAFLRVCAVFLLATHAVSSTVRELNDKGLELMLSLPISRASYFLGRWTGYAVCAAALALAFGLPLLIWSPAPAVALWSLSLALEGALVVSAALFFAMALGQAVPAIALTVAVYLLGRTMAAAQAIAQGPLADATWVSRLAGHGLDMIALLAPRLDAVTRTEWLLYAAPAPGDYAMALGALAVYAVLLLAAGLFDFHRKAL